MTSTDSNIILPIYCPPWCDRSHKQALEETGDAGFWSPEGRRRSP